MKYVKYKLKFLIFLFSYFIFNLAATLKNQICNDCIKNYSCSNELAKKFKCCENHCMKSDLYQCHCNSFENLTPEQIIDTVDDPNIIKTHRINKNNCCCCKNSNKLKIAHYNDINLNLETIDYDISLNALYKPPLNNSLNDDLIVNTKIINPINFFKNNEDISTINDDEFSTSQIQKNNDSIEIKTDLKTENIAHMLEKKRNSIFIIEKKLEKNDTVLINHNRLQT